MSNLFDAIKAGRQLSNSTTWKNAQVLGSSLAAIAGFVVALLPLFGIDTHGVSSDLVGQIGTGLGLVVAGVLNIYTTVATTKTIGIGRPAPGATTDVPPVGASAGGRPESAGNGPVAVAPASDGKRAIKVGNEDDGWDVMG